ncbi:hypothetical protein GCM10018793_67410 [Streptomyces sulfonofaciens]|uniref:Uncharacterized protein n=1 Tax=Streptomyces sulfonofaciens TaxID=68272 RepID=A0A919GQB8_9ACTN|nr:hypothetical protein [Streptomyces sulfonofaciens]GHH88278.1 hypothetical protein GCM10018793_67410 [Streptomyces sulfonofaciens]
MLVQAAFDHGLLIAEDEDADVLGRGDVRSATRSAAMGWSRESRQTKSSPKGRDCDGRRRARHERPTAAIVV